MGGRVNGLVSTIGRSTLALAVAFAIVTPALAVMAITAQGHFNKTAYEAHSPIFINGDDQFEWRSGVTGGNGTQSNPYLIEGWDIVASIGFGIKIEDTDAHLLIKDVRISPSTSLSDIGIALNNASNVRIDASVMIGLGTGVRVDGSPAEEATGIMISRCTFSDSIHNVIMNNASNCIVTRSFFSGIGVSAVHFSNCSSVECSFNTFRSSYNEYEWYFYNFSPGRAEVRVQNVTVCTIDNNDFTCYGNVIGIWIHDSISVKVTNCSMMADYEDNVLVQRTNGIQVDQNVLRSGTGIAVERSTNASIGRNFLDYYYGARDLGIYIRYSEDTVVVGNTILAGGGVDFFYCNDSRATRNYIRDSALYSSSAGLAVYGGRNVSLDRNGVLDYSGPGLRILGMADRVTVEGNEIMGNMKGGSHEYLDAGFFASGSNLTIRNNRIIGNSNPVGLALYYCVNSGLIGNRISDNVEILHGGNLRVESNTFDGWNLTVEASSFDLGNFTFLLNNFVGGIRVTVDSDTNATCWDGGYPIGGNYWSTYSGADLNSGPDQNQTGSDGFGDTPYLVNASSVDRYPRMMMGVTVDSNPPMTTAMLNGSIGLRTWHTSDVGVALECFDCMSPTWTTHYRLDSGTWSTYVAEVPVSGDGLHTLEFYSEDSENNIEETQSIQIKIDTVSPHNTTQSMPNYDFRIKRPTIVNVDLHFEDDLSGLSFVSESYVIRYTSWSAEYSSNASLGITPTNGSYVLTVEATDFAGNTESTNLTLEASVSPNTDPLSRGGPYGPWFLVLFLVDIGLGVATLLSFKSNRELPGTKWKPREEGERHYDEDVVDGYPKYMKKV